MAEWKPDTEFIDYLVQKTEEDARISGDTPFLASTDGTHKSLSELAEDMRAGKEERYRRMYNYFYNSPMREEFKKYKANKK